MIDLERTYCDSTLENFNRLIQDGVKSIMTYDALTQDGNDKWLVVNDGFILGASRDWLMEGGYKKIQLINGDWEYVDKQFLDIKVNETNKVKNAEKDLKYDQGKLLMSLVEPEYIEDVARVLTYGAEKYEPNSWQSVRDAERRYKDALLRHTMEYLKGVEVDEESGLTHLSHMATNIMFLSHFNRKNK